MITLITAYLQHMAVEINYLIGRGCSLSALVKGIFVLSEADNFQHPWHSPTEPHIGKIPDKISLASQHVLPFNTTGSNTKSHLPG